MTASRELRERSAAERERLAQLGAHVLEILRERLLTSADFARREPAAFEAQIGRLAIRAARDLGLLGEEARRA